MFVSNNNKTTFVGWNLRTTFETDGRLLIQPVHSNGPHLMGYLCSKWMNGWDCSIHSRDLGYGPLHEALTGLGALYIPPISCEGSAREFGSSYATPVNPVVLVWAHL